MPVTLTLVGLELEDVDRLFAKGDIAENDGMYTPKETVEHYEVSPEKSV